jgi:nucleoid-associated protein YgaU
MEKAKLKWFCIVPPGVTGELECQFNPAELKISKETAWEGNESPNFNSPWLQFAGGKPATYDLSLFFDTYAHPDVKDVREFTNELLKLTLRGAGYSMFLLPFASPPMVTFIWGKITLFMAVVEKVEITFTMFSPDGLPIRAKADVSFKQQDFWDDIVPAQNPTSRTDSRKTRRVHSGQRLDQIAHEEYGDPRYWRLLAEANGMDDPFQLVDGQLLVIPQNKNW